MNGVLAIKGAWSENEFSPIPLNEDVVATQPERISSLETHRTIHWVLISALAAGIVVWCGWLSNQLIDLRGDLRAIKQDMADGGWKPIVAAIQKPSSPESLKANLVLVASQVHVAQLEDKKPNPTSVSAVATAVAIAAGRNPDVPEVWSAAFELVDYKFSQNSAPRNRDCISEPGSALAQMRNSPPIGNYSVQLSNCILDLDGIQGFQKSDLNEFFMEATIKRPGNRRIIVGQGLIVRYHGGPIIPIEELDCFDCRFEFTTPVSLPAAPSRAVTQQLLTAQDTQSVNILIPAKLS